MEEEGRGEGGGENRTTLEEGGRGGKGRVSQEGRRNRRKERDKREILFKAELLFI